ncbi:MAG TPA: isoprenyl transferase [Chitinophagaceae bacterium]|nr:isoprenyl transferase [Chitinophagaceae bacterium]HMZ45286.1 isoprenyl transferase [Chitinophagaceae bacterium]HNJ57830.1 isoprenyl transferase [Chitinophagaceae bacterium]HNL82234.1 isoprenyl transferase [Chitinophagaceae bacterium]HNM33570.1 isoprenyl transferase [Chitinophagaceae bacterium]
MQPLVDKINKQRLPKHIAIIMDGNGRWAEEKGEDRLFGHFHGVESVRNIVEGCAELGIQYLTLYAFSTENWDRPQQEVDGLMTLLVDTIRKEVPELNKNNIKLHVIGNTSMLPELARNELNEAIDLLKNNTGLNLIMALSYSSRWELINAVQAIAKDVEMGNLNPNSINNTVFEKYLTTANFPDPELMIRTSGEFRISNFLLYQLAYSELYFTNTCWPDFRKNNLYEAIIEYQGRERRFGKTSKQIHDNIVLNSTSHP